MPKEKVPYESWSALNDDLILAEKERQRMSMPWRIWEISVARANNWGHAGFRKGELTRLCCGEDSPNNWLAVSRGMKVLREMGRIGPDSTGFCVVVNRGYVWRGAGKGSRKDICAEPAHMDTRETPFDPQGTASVAVSPAVADPDILEHEDTSHVEYCQACVPLIHDGVERAEVMKIHQQSLRPW
jgi:hypothetical protein